MLVLTVILKVGLIAGVLVGAGLELARASLRFSPGPASRWFDRIRRAALALAGFCALAGAALLVFRLGGSLDPAIAAIVVQSPTGAAAGLFVLGAALGLLHPKLATAGAVLIVLASGVAGHASALSFTSGMIVAMHVGVASWWTGSLLILLFACRKTDNGSLPDVLERFSRQAKPMIFVLLAAGGWAVVDLIGFSVSAFRTVYGQILLLKLVLVAGALSIALYNRRRLTPAVRHGQPGAGSRLQTNVVAELAVIGLVAIATGVLTTVLSPPAEQHTADDSPKIYRTLSMTRAEHGGMRGYRGWVESKRQRSSIPLTFPSAGRPAPNWFRQ